MSGKLFEPIKFGAIEAANRILMAPLTRARGSREHVPQPIMAEYYAQRAGAGLIFTEATGISQQGLGWPYAPGIWSDEQTEAWKPVTEAVHKKGGKIVLQLWHMGRLVHPSFLGGQPPVSSSAVTPYEDAKTPEKEGVFNAGLQAHTYDGKKPYERPRALEKSEIPGLLEDYRRAASNAKKAGFDGVQLHGANGYLIDEFLRDGVNRRTDEYGGSIENRIRLLVEVTRVLIEVWGADRVGVRLSPNGASQGTNDSNPVPLFTAAAKALNDLNIAFLELREPSPDSSFGKPEHDPIAPHMKKVFKNPLILNSDYTKQRAEAALSAGEAEAFAFGRLFISNPDLPYRLQNDIPLNKDDMKTWYSQGPEGYTDYPFAKSSL